jgi:hypothetical protein
VNTATRLRYLRDGLVVVGLIFLVGVYPLLMAWWPQGWRWQSNQLHYEQMILGSMQPRGYFLLWPRETLCSTVACFGVRSGPALFKQESWLCKRSMLPESTVTYWEISLR